MNPVLRPVSLVVALLLIAFFFRAHELAGLGLGLEHDEVAEWLIADGIRQGQHALFFEEAYGQEPMFLYLMAGSITLIGDNVIGVRFTSVFVAMLTLAAATRLLRRMFNPTVALVALAGLSIALWPVFWGRVGLRAMTLPLMLCLGFDSLWRGLNHEARGKKKHFVLAGLLVGLSAYTYLSSRAVPILLLAFLLHLAVFARHMIRRHRRNLALFVTIAALMALPLALHLLANPDLQFRVSEVSGPLDRALTGDWSDVLSNVPRALGMFTVRGDGTVRDNWPDRPVFPEPLGATLFVLGVLLALWRVRQPRYGLALIWIGAMLAPTIVSAGAPNFTRTLGALPMVFAMPGIAVDTLAKIVKAPLRPILALMLVGVFAANAISTYDDYFNKWPAHPETQFVFQADLAAIARAIDASDVTDVSIGGLSNDTMDDPSLYLLRRRKDVRVRWFDSGSPLSSGGAIVITGDSASARAYFPDIVPLAPELEAEVQQFGGGPTDADRFRFYQGPYLLWGDSALMSARYFDDTGVFVYADVLAGSTLRPGDDLRIVTRWISVEPIAYPRRVFVHLVDPDAGNTIAQHDGLDAPTRFWRMGDQIVQLHRLQIPADASPGRYELWLGLYDPITGVRVLQTDVERRQPLSDHVVLARVEVIR